MEALELPVLDPTEEQSAPPATFTEQEIDLAAFRLWHEASVPEAGKE